MTDAAPTDRELEALKVCGTAARRRSAILPMR